MSRTAPPSPRLQFRPLRRDDFPMLSAWLASGHVAPWWPEPHDPASLEVRYGPSIDREDPTEVSVVEADGKPVGLVQRYRVNDDSAWARALAVAGVPAASAGLDYLIGDAARTGHGLGPQIIDCFVATTWSRYPDVSAIAVAVQQGNRRSWRALEKSGFHRLWAGLLESDDPSDAGPSYVYLRRRP